MNNEMIDARINEIDNVKAQIKALKLIEDELVNSLKNELDERKVDMIDTGNNRVHYVPVEKMIVDTKALKAAELYEEFSKKSCSLRFTITHAVVD